MPQSAELPPDDVRAEPRARKPVVGYVLKMYPRFSETFVVSEILAREAAGERLVIFSLRPTSDARFHPELSRVQAPVVHIPRPSTAGRLWETLSTAAADPQLQHGLAAHLGELSTHTYDDAAQAMALAQQATEYGVDHLHAHFASVATTVARLAGTISGIPYSFTAHAKDIFHESVEPAELEAKLADAHHAVTISGYNLAHLRQQFPTATARLHMVRNGLELDRFPYRPHRPAHARSLPRVLGVGRLVEKKGFHLLIEAVARLHAAGAPISADIAGDGPLTDELQQRIDAAGLREHVRLLGPRTQAEVTESSPAMTSSPPRLWWAGMEMLTGCPRCCWRPWPLASRAWRPMSLAWAR